mmetsp:Transcript_20686/g.61801  ORF Transcript_20686/g.61801 Transcript_20686/m.61801 type:complete len:694 (-) Transcript_20686:179-2260(-)
MAAELWTGFKAYRELTAWVPKAFQVERLGSVRLVASLSGLSPESKRVLLSECMRLAQAFAMTRASRSPLGDVGTVDGCRAPSQEVAAVAQESQFNHIGSTFERKVLQKHLADVTCALPVHHGEMSLLTISSSTGFALHADDGEHLTAGAAETELLRDYIESVSAVGAAGDLFCYVVKTQDQTPSRWCRVFRCNEAPAAKSAAEAATKDALLTERYNFKMREVDAGLITRQDAYRKHMTEMTAAHEAGAIGGDIDRIRRTLERPYTFFGDDGEATMRYQQPPKFKNDPKDAMASTATSFPTNYHTVPQFIEDDDDDDVEELARVHAENCRRALAHKAEAIRRRSSQTCASESSGRLHATPVHAAAEGSTTPGVTPAASTGDDVTVDPATEHARLMQGQGFVNKTLVPMDRELECGCGYGYRCKTCRLRQADEEEVFEGFPDDVFETGFGNDEEEDEYIPEMYINEYGDEDDDADTDMPFSSFRCACGVPYEEFCRMCDFKARKALVGCESFAEDGDPIDLYQQSSFLDDQGVDALRNAREKGLSEEDPSTTPVDSVHVVEISDPSGDSQEGHVGYLNEKACDDMLLYVQPGQYLIRRIDASWQCIMVKTPSMDRPTIKIAVRTLEDGRLECGGRVFYRLGDVLISLRKRPLNAARKDGSAGLWLQSPIVTAVFVDQAPRKRKSIMQRLSAWRRH